MKQNIKGILDNINKVIIGKEDVTKIIFATMLAKGHVLLEDVPGVGKTTLALALAKVLGLDFKRLQFTPDTMASDIVGFSIYEKETGKLEYKKGAIFTNLFLGDEINRTSPKTQAALLEAMGEGNVTMDGSTHNLPEPFMCIATQNPVGSVGTQKLPDSQLDRFMTKLSIGYPSLEEEMKIISDRQENNPLDNLEAVITVEKLEEMIEAVQQVHIDEDVVRYIAMLCQETRTAEEIEQGISPRGSLAMVAMAKALSFINGRDYVLPEDVKNIFIPVGAHRIVLSAKSKARKVKEEDVLKSLLDNTQMPKLSK